MGQLSTISPQVLFEAICQGSPDVIVIVDDRGRIVFINDRCVDMLGYEAVELIGERVEILIPDRFQAHDQMRVAYQNFPVTRPMGKRPLLQARHKSGIEIPVDISLSPLAPVTGYGKLVQAAIRNALPRWIAEQEMQLQSVALDAAANGIVITDREGIIQWANPAVTKMTGYSSSELIGQHTRLLKSGRHNPDFYKELWETVLAGGTWFGEIANRRKDGSIYYEEQHIAPVRNELDEITYFIAIKQDVTARKMAETALQEANEALKQQVVEIEGLRQKLHEQAIRDPLTGLFNRRYLDETLARECARAARDRSTLSVVLIDVDNFKQVNDTAGHAEGDLILRSIGQLLSTAIRQSDFACRFGGDEFLILLPGAPLDMAQKRAEEWRRSFVESQESDRERSLRQATTLSLGVAELSPSLESPDSLLRRCDEALYLAKRRGRDRVVSLS